VRRAAAGLACAIGLVATILVATAGAATAPAPPPGSPDPKPMVLNSHDLGGARVTSQGYFKDADFPSLISFKRELENAKVGSTRLLYVQCQAEIGRDTQTTGLFLATLKKLIQSKQGRALLKKEILSSSDTKLTTKVQIGRPRTIAVGPGSFDLLVTLSVLTIPVQAHVTIFRVDRVLGELLTFGAIGARVPTSVVVRLAKVMAARMTAQLTPRSSAPPTISGATQVGQMLTATTGAWTGTPTAFAYQWQRCDAAGANCADISGAVAQSYQLTDADAGSTLRVTVTARNGAGSGTAASAPSAVVAPSAAPTNTGPPTIAGTAQVGQTLTATTGAWTGAPTTFAYEWQRCDGAGANCVAIPGASGATYVLSAADTGATIRVAVTAANAAGSATAVSSPTSPVAA